MLSNVMNGLEHQLGDGLEDRIICALAEISLDYTEQLAFIQKERKKGVKWAAAAVLVLLGKYPVENFPNNGYFFLLNKRSAYVRQPGDLCFPGGHPNRWIDFLSSRLIVPYMLSMKKGSGFKMLRQRSRRTFRNTMFFLGNGLRESFEEIRLNPFKVDFLGALRSYNLEIFHRIIFPMVGIIRGNVKIKPNWEVERIIRIPLSSLLIPENYAIYKLVVKGRFQSILQSDRVEYDCFVHHEAGRQDEILWGASYEIVQSFLKAVFDFDPPTQNFRPMVHGEFYPSVS